MVGGFIYDIIIILGTWGQLMLILDNDIPVRLPVKWYYDNISNEIIIEYEKEFSNLELILSKLLKSPRYLKRRLDLMNSRLWLLMDGNNNFKDIIKIMESDFKEQILPSKQRIQASILIFMDLRLSTVVKNAESISWNVEQYKD